LKSELKHRLSIKLSHKQQQQLTSLQFTAASYT